MRVPEDPDAGTRRPRCGHPRGQMRVPEGPDAGTRGRESLKDDVDAAVEARMERQRVLYTGDRQFRALTRSRFSGLGSATPTSRRASSSPGRPDGRPPRLVPGLDADRREAGVGVGRVFGPRAWLSDYARGCLTIRFGLMPAS
jgi:hypothetical protein